ncbi:hypothetical protein HMPREF0554_0132 [Pseudoleptotrichia goodfellowii F0264]|uniref:Shikimate kinase n=2 Tax=Pseudoleptotrichia goodfellowii TaxID=157692 RepID=D0GIT4_9FUSO|nr:hypothetical protein HMPREF0554_0132 [Pseudoleptotrichia goodfellowii F0264]
MSGVGKTTILSMLQDENTICIDLDETDYIEVDIETKERLISIDKLLSYINSISDKNLILAVCEANQGQIYSLMSAVIVLTASLEVMKERINKRQNNNYGKDKEEWEQIVRNKKEIESLLIRRADYVIQTDGEIHEVFNKVKMIIDEV